MDWDGAFRNGCLQNFRRPNLKLLFLSPSRNLGGVSQNYLYFWGIPVIRTIDYSG